MSYTVGQKVRLGTLKVNGTVYAQPSNPKDGGNCVSSNTTSIEIADTIAGKELTFIYVEDNGKKLLICDRCLVVNVKWDTLNSAGLIFGKEITIDGKKYKVRSMTGGVNGNDKNNEWSRIIENNQYGIGNGNDVWHWQNMYTWCQETYSNNSAYRLVRGYSSAAAWGSTGHDGDSSYLGFRPVLEILNAAPLISDSDRDLGDRTSPIIQSYTISDEDGHKMRVTETLDDVVIKNLTEQTNGTHTVNLTTKWAALANGPHTIKITVADTEDESAVRIYTFNKTNTPPPKPLIETPLNGMRRTRVFDVVFCPQQDAEGNTQTFTVEVADDEEFTTNVLVFTELKKKVGHAWVPADNFTNEDFGTQYKISVLLENDNAKFVRVSAIDPDGSQTKIYSDVVSFSLPDTLQIETIPYKPKFNCTAATVNLESLIDPKATIQVEICNNANDTQPVWEDMTNEFSSNSEHEFENETIANGKAISVRVTIAANEATGEIKIKAIGLGVR